MCSTPTGIKGKGTLLVKPNSSRTKCAQRLQASKVKALFLVRTNLYLFPECSTPTGIKGKGTLWGKTIVCPEPECSTPTGIKGKGTHNQAVKISSSQSAQRLQASKVKAHIAKQILEKTMKCSTPTGIKGKGTSHSLQTG